MVEFYNLYSYINVYEKLFHLLFDNFVDIICSRKRKTFTENVGKYVPPNIDDTNFKNSVITNKNFDETWTSLTNFVNDSF